MPSAGPHSLVCRLPAVVVSAPNSHSSAGLRAGMPTRKAAVTTSSEQETIPGRAWRTRRRGRRQPRQGARSAVRRADARLRPQVRPARGAAGQGDGGSARRREEAARRARGVHEGGGRVAERRLRAEQEAGPRRIKDLGRELRDTAQQFEQKVAQLDELVAAEPARAAAAAARAAPGARATTSGSGSKTCWPAWRARRRSCAATRRIARRWRRC